MWSSYHDKQHSVLQHLMKESTGMKWKGNYNNSIALRHLFSFSLQISKVHNWWQLKCLQFDLLETHWVWWRAVVYAKACCRLQRCYSHKYTGGRPQFRADFCDRALQLCNAQQHPWGSPTHQMLWWKGVRLSEPHYCIAVRPALTG